MSFSHPRPKPTRLRQADESKFFALHEQALHLRGFMRSSVGLSSFLPFTVFACSLAAFVPLQLKSRACLRAYLHAILKEFILGWGRGITNNK